MKWIQFQQGKYKPGCCFRVFDNIGYIYFNGAVDEDGRPYDPDGEMEIWEEDYPNIYFLDESNDEVEQLRTKLAEMTAAHDQYRGMYQKLQRERTVENEQLREDIKVLEDWNEQCSATYDEMLKENESLQSQLNQYREALAQCESYLDSFKDQWKEGEEVLSVIIQQALTKQ